MKRLKIAYLSADNPADIHAWSGTHYSIYQSLLSLGEVEILGPYHNPFIFFLIRLKKIIYKLFGNKRYNGYHSKLLARSYGRHFTKKTEGKNFDLIVAVSASAELAYLKTTIPVVFVSDALFSGTLNYNKTLTNLCKESIKEGFETEKNALENATLCYLPSEWVKNDAIANFKIDESKIAIGCFGANLNHIPTAEFVLNYKNQKDNSVIELIFVGVDWINKGGPKAYNCLLEILSQGYKAQLTIVGCVIPENFRHPNIKNIPFIKKTTDEGRKEFEKLYLNADFLILPTLVDAYGIVFCEASAYGVINIAANTGGTSSPVKTDVNGYLISPESDGKEYAEIIISVFNGKEKLNALRISSRKRYDDVLNWKVWTENLKKILEDKKIVS